MYLPLPTLFITLYGKLRFKQKYYKENKSGRFPVILRPNILLLQRK